MAAHPDDVHGSISAKEDRYLAHNTKNSHRESPRRDILQVSAANALTVAETNIRPAHTKP
jgi:hypothetical protein